MTEAKELVQDYLCTAHWVTASEIAEATGQPKEETEGHLEELHDEGKSIITARDIR